MHHCFSYCYVSECFPWLCFRNSFPFFVFLQKCFLTLCLCVKIYLLTTCVSLAPSGRLFPTISEGYWGTKTMGLSAAPSGWFVVFCSNNKDDKGDIYSACTDPAGLGACSRRVRLCLRSRVPVAVTFLRLCKYCNHKGSKNTEVSGCNTALLEEHVWMSCTFICFSSINVLRTNCNRLKLIPCVSLIAAFLKLRSDHQVCLHRTPCTSRWKVPLLTLIPPLPLITANHALFFRLKIRPPQEDMQQLILMPLPSVAILGQDPLTGTR